MSRDVEYTNEFGAWWVELAEQEQDDVTAVVELLMEHGPRLPFPYSSAVMGSRHGHMREDSACKAVAGPYASSMRSTRDDRQSC